MLFNLLFISISSTAVATEKKISLSYSRTCMISFLLIIFIAYFDLYIKSIKQGIGLYNGLLNITTFSQTFNIYILLLASIICILTAFYPRKVVFFNNANTVEVKANNDTDVNSTNKIEKEFIHNRTSSQFTIIEYSLITVFVLCGAVLLMSTGDLISLFLSIELQSYGLYILATIYRDSESATGSGLTYFLLGALSSCFILLGSAMLYVNSGTTDLDNLYTINNISEFTYLTSNTYDNSIFSVLSWGEVYGYNYINFSLIVLSVGFLFKISAAPFHFWSPDVYDGIPTIVTTFVAIIAKISIFILLLELVSYMEITQSFNTENNTSTQYLTWKNVIILSSLMSLIVGSVLGLTQYRIKRLLAYSTISHVGFILLALCVNNMEAIQGYLFYILQYSLSNLNAFFILITIGYTLYSYEYKTNNNKEDNKSEEFKFIDISNSPVQLLSQLKGHFYINSFLSISLAITLFSFVGIPPLIGFFAKQMVLSAALDKGYVFITLIGVITSVIGAVYYLNIVKLLFFSEGDYSKVNKLSNNINDTNNNILVHTNSMLNITITILTMLILLFIFTPDEWFRIVELLSLSLSKY